MNLTYDGNTLTIGGSTGGTGTIVNVYGSSGQLFSVTDSLTGTLFQVGDISGNPILQVNSNGAVYLNSSINAGITGGTTTLLSIDKTTGTACYFDYRVSNSSTGAYRAGTVMSVWDGTNIEYTDTSTADLVASTAGIEFVVSVSGSNIIISSVVTTGTWSIKVGARVI